MPPRAVSGFPEWLPQGRAVERHVLDTLRRVFELHSFQEIETRAVEPVAQLLSKGETSKEIYGVTRLGRDAAEVADAAGLGLHFDLTVPLARYVLENVSGLVFPFKRYQIQKVWRGERPQEGRFREFTQADIDVIGRDTLPFHFEVDLPLVMAQAFAELGLPVRIAVNNRKICQGFYVGVGLTDVDAVLRLVDKLDKIGPDAVAEQLLAAGAGSEQAAACLELAQIAGEDATQVTQAVNQLAARYGVAGEALALMQTGLAELSALLEAARLAQPGVVVAQLKIARGLDYYTGSVYETTWLGHEDLGSICSGGRYDRLAADRRATYPGVGLSVGVTRLVSRLINADLMRPTRLAPAACLVAVVNEPDRADSDAVARQLRSRGIAVEVAPTAAKFGKQIAYADKLGIPFVWFPEAGSAAGQVKDIRSGEQAVADPTTWNPPPADLSPSVRAAKL